MTLPCERASDPGFLMNGNLGPVVAARAWRSIARTLGTSLVLQRSLATMRSGIRVPSMTFEYALQIADPLRASPGAAVLPGAPRVFVVDDDAAMRSCLRRLLASNGFSVETCASGAELLMRVVVDRPGCILLDVSMPMMGGLEVQRQLGQLGISLPVIFLTGVADVPVAVAALRAGAADFIEKPFDNDDLVARVRLASARHGQRLDAGMVRVQAQARLDGLTPRESSVLDHVVAGETSKEIARTLGVSHRTVEVHRRHLMQKMRASTLAELVRMRLAASDQRDGAK